jgi:beta-aspartyl-peptidase (threonine type)
VFAMAVHGGAGTWEPEHHAAALAGLSAALAAGIAVLQGGSSALDAVVAAATVLEDDPVFNAGTGSTLNLDGEIEVDAAVMAGNGQRAGAVACVKNVRNPVKLARRVMEDTDHVLLAGEGAEALARAWGLAAKNEPTPDRRRRWEAARAKLARDAEPAKLAALLKAHPELARERRGTIGAVARDAHGHTAAATSTGGVLLKLPGRIGDTPVPGAGNYANAAGAASATGQGELILRALTTKTACDLMAQGFTADSAARTALIRTAREAGSDLGLITVDLWGGIGIAHATANMPHAFQAEGGAPLARMRAGQAP